MTTMTIQEQIAVMQAFAKGKRIQSQSNHVTDDAWCPSLHPSWDWYHHDYRVDPTDVDMVKAPLDRSVFEGRPAWLRYPAVKFPGASYFGVLNIGKDGLRVYMGEAPGHPEGFKCLPYQWMVDHDFEYSYDCKTWLPCHKLVPAS